MKKKKKRKNKSTTSYDIITVVSILIATVLSFSLGLYVDKFPPINSKIEYASSSNCSGLPLKEGARCMVAYVSEFYKYNETDDNIILTEEDLRNRGGDCRDWAMYYVKFARKLGYYSSTKVMPIKNTLMHEITVVSNEEGYCVIDQRAYHCTMLKGFGKIDK